MAELASIVLDPPPPKEEKQHSVVPCVSKIGEKMLEPASVSKKKLFFKFDASLKAPDYMEIFMQNGGQIDSMAARWQTDFAVSGCKTSTFVEFKRDHTTLVAIELPDNVIGTVDGDGSVSLPATMRLNVMTQRMCASINGTLVTSLSGESTAFLDHVLRGRPHFQMGMVYKTYMAHSASLAISNARIVSEEEGIEVRHKPKFSKMGDREKTTLSNAGDISEEYAKVASNIRQVVKYDASPMLHKAVYTESVGINARGYNLLHAIMDREANLSLGTLNSLYEAAIACDLCQDREDIKIFENKTSLPGLDAAEQARAVCSATSLIVNVLMSYRADGRNVVTPTGAQFSSVENWNPSVPRCYGLESNDCDGLALLAIELIRSATNLTPEQIDNTEYTYLRSVRNVVFPHYQVSLSVIGATAAEANSAKADHSAIAGHAIAVMIPTMSLLKSLEKTGQKKIGKDGPLMYAADKHERVTNLRFAALYSPDYVRSLPMSEQEPLASWPTAKHESKFTSLKPFAIEGTTPTSPLLYMEDLKARELAHKQAESDKVVFSKAAPNVFRSRKILHVGGSRNDSTHSFYSDLVELTFAPDNPLYSSPSLRAESVAASQYVLTYDIDGDEIQHAGCSPRQLVMEKYGAFPLVQLNSQSAAIIEFASNFAKLDVMPPRVKEPLQLSDYQSQTLEESMKHISGLETAFKEKTAKDTIPTTSSHCVAYVVAFNTLVHNPNGVKQFVETMYRCAVDGIVDKRIIPGLALDNKGEDVGIFLHLDMYIPL